MNKPLVFRMHDLMKGVYEILQVAHMENSKATRGEKDGNCIAESIR